ncbi:LacI family DNA-binding transcriptional regulator [Cognatishimia sp. SS12]|uniref:LacI family DNA-binding transcriptional regulator n=1 Tax=Cognatishimia sp. SS12 TaxID=2979465 RepID=UPI00232E1723|nr:LacI family DNA-binding transcriptional regulator [Cognatishimia sp. SS12]MDC0738435.1 LacI family DNA-binding transcriptional regulator [Cognatishimia sp. SS12]
MKHNEDAVAPNRPRRVTATDVAKAAGVSRSAVSRAFTQGAYLDQEKKERILACAQELGYHPNAFAAGLQTTQSNIVAVITGEMRSQYDHELVDHLLKGLLAIGKWPMVLSGRELASAPNLQGIFGFPVDAMIVRGGSVDPFVTNACAKLQIPLIISGCIVKAPLVDSVSCRNFDGMFALAKLLAASGRRRIGFIDGVPNRASKAERPAGAKAGLAEHGLSFVATITSDYSYHGGLQAAQTLLAEHDLDAIMCANDETAIGAITAVQDVLGKRVPEDVAITGFDNLKMAAWPNFNLTTVQNPIRDTVAQILRLLQERLANPAKPGETVLTDAPVVARGTH